MRGSSIRLRHTSKMGIPKRLEHTTVPHRMKIENTAVTTKPRVTKANIDLTESVHMLHCLKEYVVPVYGPIRLQKCRSVGRLLVSRAHGGSISTS